MKIEKRLPKIQKNISLKNYTFFRIGGPAKYFLKVEEKQDLIEAVKVAKDIKLPFFILGAGSNLLISDKGFNGLVIKIGNKEYEIKDREIFVEAGMMLGELLMALLKDELIGLEWASGIPGTIGGAIQGNAGSFGKSMKDNVKEVEVFDLKEQKIKTFKNKDCRFDYRESVFKKNRNLIILSVKIQLKKGNKKEIEKRIKESLDYRKATQPLGFPSAGSIFKNPPGFSAGDLIEKCGLKGKKIRGAKISEKHANFIVNLGEARAKDVMALIGLIKKEVKEKKGILLEEEIQFLGF